MDEVQNTAREQNYPPMRTGAQGAITNPAEKNQKHLTMLEDELNQMAGNIQKLEERLHPILELRPEDPNRDNLKEPESGKLSARILTCLKDVRRFNTKILDLTDRLEV